MTPSNGIYLLKVHVIGVWSWGLPNYKLSLFHNVLTSSKFRSLIRKNRYSKDWHGYPLESEVAIHLLVVLSPLSDLLLPISSEVTVISHMRWFDLQWDTKCYTHISLNEYTMNTNILLNEYTIVGLLIYLWMEIRQLLLLGSRILATMNIILKVSFYLYFNSFHLNNNERNYLVIEWPCKYCSIFKIFGH